MSAVEIGGLFLSVVAQLI